MCGPVQHLGGPLLSSSHAVVRLPTMAEWDSNTKANVQKIPMLTVKAGPRDGEEWGKRLKEVR